jgi:predicted CopG family antitoxin
MEVFVAVKTITIDLEAYSLLRKQKRENDSFSDVIKRRFRPKKTIADLLATIEKTSLSGNYLNGVESRLKSARKEKLGGRR